jgi:high-affinity Fe2+/Pb2+ permease
MDRTRLNFDEKGSALGNLASSAMAIAMIAAAALAIGGVKLLFNADYRGKGVLMLVMAVVLVAYVLIWTL